MAADKHEKKEKKDKKRSDESGVSKSKKDKKDKKDKKEKLAAALEEKLQKDAAAQSAAPVKAVKAAAAEDSDSDMEDKSQEVVTLERTVVPFAVPLADEKGQKKVYKTIRKGKGIPIRYHSFSEIEYKNNSLTFVLISRQEQHP